jgi:microcystin-dependent protein
MPTTPILKLPYPADVAPADVPTDIEALARAIEALGGISLPGDLKTSAAHTPPAGWLLCDGRAVGRIAYRALFEAIDVAYGDGDGETTFNIPDARDCVLVGASTARPLGSRGGAAAVALSVAEMAHHAHGVADPTHGHVVYDPSHNHGLPLLGENVPRAEGGAGSAVISAGLATLHAGTGISLYGSGTGISIYGEGGGQAHNNMPPYIGVNVFIKT